MQVTIRIVCPVFDIDLEIDEARDLHAKLAKIFGKPELGATGFPADAEKLISDAISDAIKIINDIPSEPGTTKPNLL